MTKKQGPEKTEMVKEEEQGKEAYIFQKNTKTKVGTYIIIGILILCVLGILVSIFMFGSPDA